MLWITILLLAILFVIALVMTLQVAKQQNQEIEKREQQGLTAEDEMQQSHQYETESLNRNIPNLIKIYIGLFVIIIGFIATILIIL